MSKLPLVQSSRDLSITKANGQILVSILQDLYACIVVVKCVGAKGWGKATRNSGWIYGIDGQIYSSRVESEGSS